MQKNALESLDNLRNNNKDKALLISATGTGKTYLAAFDVKAVHPKECCLLFIVEVLLLKRWKHLKQLLKINLWDYFQEIQKR